ncbi:MAG: hypothetical protein ACTSYZ_09925 [Candidatus Helarchaeota archaeon]
MASKPKTIFERLEERMEKLEQIINTIVPGILDQVIPALDKVKEDLPASIGPNLMNFADMIGEQIENVSKSVSSISSPGGGGPVNVDLSEVTASLNKILDSFNVLLKGFDQVNSKIDNLTSEISLLKNDVNQIKAISSSVAPVTQTAPPVNVRPQVTAQPATPAPASFQATAQPKPTPTIKAAPAPTITPQEKIPTITTESSVVPTEVFDLFDSITEKLKSGMLAQQMAQHMEQVRDKIVNIYKWHPTLYELASQARKLKKAGVEDPVDADTYQLLLEKVQEWKQRIKTG